MLVRLPPFSLMLGLLAAMMLGPAVLSLLEREWFAARSFLYAALFTGFAAAALATVLAGHAREASARSELVMLIVTWLLAPLFAAAPLILITPGLGIVGSYFEMMLCFTTTGGSSYADLTRVPDAIHLWRGMVGWAGGLLTLAAAYVVFAPRRLGGFEVFAASAYGGGGMGSRLVALGAAAPELHHRLSRALRSILPVYIGLTAGLALIFTALGAEGVAGMVHAMSVVSTTGVSPYPDGIAQAESFWMELAAAAFLLLTATRLIYAAASQSGSTGPWAQDPELRLLGALVLLASLTLFLRHWLGALTIDLGETAGQDAGTAIWGTIFTTLSFLTTTGFQSAFWDSARDWSGLANPHLILLGLCAIGGGAATAAGGIKLIRLYALTRHGIRELERLAQPSAVIGVGVEARGILRQGAFIAWAFIMLYVMGWMTIMLALTLTGLTYEEALVGAISTLSNTGQAYSLVLEGERTLATTTPSQRFIMAAAMVLGRIETLALIALFNPGSWQLFGLTSAGGGKHRRATPDQW